MRPPFPRQHLLIAALLTAGLGLAAPPTDVPIYVAYPKEGASVPFDHVIFEGSVRPGGRLSVNGRPVETGPDGLFIEWLPLRAGVNDLRLQSGGARRIFRIISRPVRTPPARPTAIALDSLAPNNNLTLWGLGELDPGQRTLHVEFRGSPGGAASFKVGARGPFPMTEAAGVYSGSWAVPAGESLTNAAIVVRLAGRDRRSQNATATGRLSAGGPARVGLVTAPDVGLAVNPSTTEWNTGPDGGPNIYPKQGARTIVVGSDGGFWLARPAPGLLARVPKDSLQLRPVGEARPNALVSPAGIEDTGGQTVLRLPLSERVPFTFEQTVDGAQRLGLRLFHVTAPLNPVDEVQPAGLISGLTWTPEAGGARLDLDLDLKQQWGYTATYQGTTLVLAIKRPPTLDAARPLAGRRIVVDPGHGGSQLGGAGALRVWEKDITLPMGIKLAAQLRALGADVTLTRERDQLVELYDRPLKAEAVNADLIVSVHANALPDGKDPRGVRGSGVYIYQPQTRALAESISAALARGLPEVGSQGVIEKSLALTRPSRQLSLLVETAYLTDKSNLRLLMSESGKDRFARAIADGILNFYTTQAP